MLPTARSYRELRLRIARRTFAAYYAFPPTVDVTVYAAPLIAAMPVTDVAFSEWIETSFSSVLPHHLHTFRHLNH